jgi:4-aminobutyrate aminotransferase-like enzyme
LSQPCHPQGRGQSPQGPRFWSEYIAAAWSNNLGANDPRVVEAAIAQLREMTHIRPNFDSLPRQKLVAKLKEIAPGNLKQMGFTLHGSLAGEMAMKLAFKNRPGAQNLIVLQDGYHGRSLATLAASWHTPTIHSCRCSRAAPALPTPIPTAPASGWTARPNPSSA